MEVVVHAVFGDGSRTRVVVELDGANVLEGSRGTWGLQTFRSCSCGGSRSRSFGEVLDDSNVFGATVVVHGPQDVDRSGSDLRVLPT